MNRVLLCLIFFAINQICPLFSMPPRSKNSVSPVIADQLSKSDDSKTLNEAKLIKNDPQDEPNQLEKPKKVFENPEKRPDIVRRPIHLDAVPLERDGSLNQKYKQELLLNANMNQNVIVENDAKDQSEKEGRWIEEIFKKVDSNKDRKVTQTELEDYIHGNIMRHLDEAINESRIAFDLIDTDKNGFATWDEYHYHFLVDKKLMEPEKAKEKHDEKLHNGISASDQEVMDKELRVWHQSDMEPKDGQLSPDEFLAFRHPEHSKVGLNEMVRQIFEQLDKAEPDDRLSLKEFVNFEQPPPDETGLQQKEQHHIDNDEVKDREDEFQEADTNRDGFVDFQELLAHVNPANPAHARREANGLFSIADENADGKLSVKEMKKHAAFFLGSSIANAAGLMHDEF